MKVSIIIPIYNVENEIERCLLSVINQDYKDIELILVNDHSPDQSFEIAKKIIKDRGFYAQTKFIDHDTNKGLSIARNSGIDVSEGFFLFFLDSDDALASSQAISSLIGIVNTQTPCPQIIIGNRWIEKDQAVPVLKEHYYRGNDNIYTAYLQCEFSVIGCGKLIQRQFLIDNDLIFLQNIYHEDELWWFNVCRKAESIYVSSQVVYHIFQRPGSITSSVTEKHARDWVTIVLAMYATYKKNPDYHGNETILWIEYVRRKCIKRLFLFDDKRFLLCELRRLQQIKFPIKAISDKKLVKLNLIMRMPTLLVMWYFKLRYSYN